MSTFGFQELLVVAVVALLVFGPDRLPELARRSGELIARFRSETARSVEELKRAADIGDLDRELRGLARDVRDVKGSVGRAVRNQAEAVTRPRQPDQPAPVDPEAT
ncbi:MAG TPA: Sec-independent protein translocase protein TatB [Nitriliruptorales bacterium]